MEITLTTRGIIIKDKKLLVFKLHPEASFYSLPGGRLEFGETIHEGIQREIFEETGIKPMVGKILLVNQLIQNDRHRVEFFFFIENANDFEKIDLFKASHGHEVVSFEFADIKDSAIQIKPDFLKDVVKEIIKKGIDNFSFRILLSH